jgi:hypothetical protein
MSQVNISGSYVQDQRHESVSAKYNPIQASAVGEVMTANGLTLSSLSTGRARHEDKRDFQKTLSRYRGPEIANDGKPIFLDVVYSSKHMGRGTDQLWLGIYRMICTNGLIAGTNFFKFGVRHAGDTYNQLDAGIKQALAYQAKLTELIEKARSIELNPDSFKVLEDAAINALVPSHAINVRHTLNRVRRLEDAGNSAWLVYNRIQENAMHGRIAYQVETKDENGNFLELRHMTVRPVKVNTNRDTQLNQSLFDALEGVIKAA